MQPVLISYMNRSSTVKDEDVAAAVPAFAKQLSRDFAPVWGAAPGVEFVPMSASGFAGNVLAMLVDSMSEAPDALGYHDVDRDGSVTGVVGMPYIKVLANAPGYDWRTTASHENLELSADYSANLWADSPDGTHDVAYGEVADPDENSTYDVDGVPCSNFVYRAWFDPSAQAVEKLDHMGNLKTPNDIASGGYKIVRTEPGQVSQVTASHQAKGHDVHVAVDHQESRHGRTVLVVFGSSYPEDKKKGKLWKVQRKHKKTL